MALETPRTTGFQATPGFDSTKRRTGLRLRAVLALVLAIVAGYSTAQRLEGFDWRYTKPDFRIFYSWGIDRLDGRDIWAEPAAGMVRPGISRRFCNFTPFFVEAFTPLAHLSQRTGHRVWQGIVLGGLIAALVLLARGIEPPLDVATTVIFVSLVVVSQTTREVLKFSQMSPLLLPPMVISWLASRRGRPMVAGLALAAAVLLKLYPGAFAGYLLLKRRWLELGWTAVFCAAGIALSGPGNWVNMFTLGIPPSLPWILTRNSLHASVLPVVHSLLAHSALFMRGNPPWRAVLAVTAVIDLVLIALVACATFRADDNVEQDGIVFGLWLGLCVMLSPLAWRHDLPLFFPLYLFAALAIVRLLAIQAAWTRADFISGCALLAGSSAIELIHSIPDPNPQLILAMLIFVASLLILRARIALRI
ncbi:MAG TPA: glycosyltransferase family 87 protein [Candidatus Binataceae bacterium]|nr:glycosyltransferase family 87 protein [Candidatus Binataceae bacterium]